MPNAASAEDDANSLYPPPRPPELLPAKVPRPKPRPPLPGACRFCLHLGGHISEQKEKEDEGACETCILRVILVSKKEKEDEGACKGDHDHKKTSHD